jgi:tetratricopeptide (TPR) repeat protein
MTTTQIDNPYVGPRAYLEGEGDRFFGRDLEERELLWLDLANRLVLFYAPSGAGKTSLVNAKLIPGLKDKGLEVLPVGRVSGQAPFALDEDDNPFAISLNLSLVQHGKVPRRIARLPLSDFLEGLVEDAKGYRHTGEGPASAATGTEPEAAEPAAPDQDTATRPRVLIIDQFEEILTTNVQAWKKRPFFFDQLRKAMEKDPHLRVVLAMREDFVAGLDPIAHRLPDSIRIRYYMERMSTKAALEAVRKPVEKIRPFEEGVAEKLVEDLSLIRVPGQEGRIPGQFIEPMFLQVVCYQLWENVRDQPGDTITSGDRTAYADVDTALGAFYNGAITWALEKSGMAVSERRLRQWYGTTLIFPEARARIPPIPVGPHETGGLPNEIVELLWLLRWEKRGDELFIELSHDRLVDPILRANQAWLEEHENPITVAAQAWKASGKSPRLALTGPELEAAQAHLKRAPEEFTELDIEFVSASEKAEQARKELLSAHRIALLEWKKYLSETGWGVIFAEDADPAIREALKPLLDHRRKQSTLKRKDYYKEFVGGDGYSSEESARKFLARHGVGPGKIDPSSVPYYLLIVGDPETIPFEFQYQLDVNYAVGRVVFEELPDYREYAESVVRAETGQRTRPRNMAFFAPSQPDNVVQRSAVEELVTPLADQLEAQEPDWEFSRVIGERAKKAKLAQLVGGRETPALLFVCSTPVMGRPKGDKRQTADQGALICQEWPGPVRWSFTIPEEFYFAADDVGDEVDTHGLVAFLFSSYGAGTPRMDDFPEVTSAEREAIAAQAFVAKLPQRLLSHPNGGALAVIGKVERAWTYLFQWPGVGSRSGVETFASLLASLMDGYPVGAVMEPFNHRYAELAAELCEELREIEHGKVPDPYEVAGMWTSTTDARNWVIVGDPAVRLMVEGVQPDTKSLTLLYQTEELRKAGDQLAKEGKIELAKAEYLKALVLNPWLGLEPEQEARRVAAREARTLDREAEKSAKEGKFDEATSLFEQAIKLDPDLGIDPALKAGRLAAPFYAKEGRRLAREGRFEEAMAQRKRALELDATLVLEPEEEARKAATDVLVKQGRELAKRGDIDGGLNRLKRAAEIDPGLPLDPRKEVARLAVPLLLEEGGELAQKGDVEGAVTIFKTAVGLDPELDLEPRAEAGRLATPRILEEAESLAREGDVDRAAALFERAVTLNSDLDIDPQAEAQRIADQTRAQALVAEGRTLAATGDAAGAQVLFEEAVALDPKLDIDPVAEAQVRERLLPGAGLKASLWNPGQLVRIRFLGGDRHHHEAVMAAAQDWMEYANIKFEFGDDPDAEIRIAFEPTSSWSYQGTAALRIAQDRPTMNILPPDLAGEEVKSAGLRLFGYVLGMIREQQNPNAKIPWNREAVYTVLENRGLDKRRVDRMLFSLYDPDTLAVVKDFDPLSINLWPPITQEMTDGDFEAGPNRELSDLDKKTVGDIYPYEDGSEEN